MYLDDINVYFALIKYIDDAIIAKIFFKVLMIAYI